MLIYNMPHQLMESKTRLTALAIDMISCLRHLHICIINRVALIYNINNVCIILSFNHYATIYYSRYLIKYIISQYEL